MRTFYGKKGDIYVSEEKMNNQKKKVAMLFISTLYCYERH